MYWSGPALRLPLRALRTVCAVGCPTVVLSADCGIGWCLTVVVLGLTGLRSPPVCVWCVSVVRVLGAGARVDCPSSGMCPMRVDDFVANTASNRIGVG